MSYLMIDALASEHPSKPAIIHNSTTIQFSQFANAIGTTAEFIATYDLTEGHNAVIVIDDRLDCWTAILALQSLGLNTICVHRVEVLKILAIKNIAAFVTTEKELSQYQVKFGALAGSRTVRIPNPEYNSNPPTRIHRGSKIAGGHILYTSGTTGYYKKLLISAGQQEKRDTERIQQMGLDGETYFHCISYGQWTSVGYLLPLSTWRAGGCVIIDQRPEWPHYFLNSGVTRSVLLPDYLNQLLKVVGESGDKTPLENLILYASGGFISRQVAEQVLADLTQNLAVSYGSTEVAIAALESMVTDLDNLHWLAPTHIRRVEIVDINDAICPVDQEGQLRIKLEEQDCESYLDDAEVSEIMFRNGYFYPGDIAVRRADGRIRILGRNVDVVNFRGQKFPASPFENYAQDFLGVSNACLFSGVSEGDQAEVIVVIECEQWPDKRRMNNLSRKFQEFDQIRFAKMHPFPRTQTGMEKIDREKLRNLVFAGKPQKTA